MSPTADQFAGCLFGLAVGDALGAPVEGLGGDLIHSMGPAGELVKNPSGGTLYYTDDTQMTIGVAETLVECGEIRVKELCAAFAENYDPARGYGQGARRVIEAMATGDDWRELAGSLFPGGSYGNGAAMRVAPVGLLFCDDLERVAVGGDGLFVLAVDGPVGAVVLLPVVDDLHDDPVAEILWVVHGDGQVVDALIRRLQLKVRHPCCLLGYVVVTRLHRDLAAVVVLDPMAR